ncbi:hypothetical protein D3C71_1451970 [compost metagenome]
MHRAVAQLGDVQARFAQLDFGAVLEANRHGGVIDPHFAFGGHAGYGHVLELTAVDGLRHHAELFDDLGMRGGVGNRQAYQHRHGVHIVRSRRMAAAVLDVTALAGIGVEQRAEAIARGRRRRGDHPRAAEEAVADAEIHTPGRRQVRRGHGKRVLIGLAHRRTAAGAGFTGFGLGEFRGVIAGTQAQGQKQCGQAKRQRGHQTSCKTSKTRAQSLTGDGNLNKRNYRLLDVGQVICLTHNPLWERACSRRRGVSPHGGCLTRRFREQARSHNGMCVADMKKATRRSPFSFSQR